MRQLQLYHFITVTVPGRSWPELNLLVPLNSTVEISCTLNDSNRSYWSIDLANDGTDSQKQFVELGGQRALLNSYGIYELSSIESEGNPLTLRLLINDTESNNQTKIFCISGLYFISREKTLTVYGKSISRIFRWVGGKGGGRVSKYTCTYMHS